MIIQNKLPKLSIIVVNKNGARFLDECLQSIFGQTYENKEVIVIDGGSTDGSQDIIKAYESSLDFFKSESDNGQYEAVEKGFAKSTGQLMAWINSDDKYLPGAFQTAVEIFSKFEEVDWLMGYPGEFDANGTLFRRINLPWARWSKLRYYTYDFQFIQQESCFWRRSLWEKAGAQMNKDTELAGDLALWLRFFRHAKLYTTVSCLAGFRQHSLDQRSHARRGDYLSECQKLITSELKDKSLFTRFGLALLRVFGFLLWPFYFYEIPLLKHLYRWTYRIPKLINYNANRHEHEFSELVMKLPPVFIFGQNLTRDRINRAIRW